MQLYKGRVAIIIGMHRGYYVVPFDREKDDYGLYVNGVVNNFYTPLALRGTREEVEGFVEEWKRLSKLKAEIQRALDDVIIGTTQPPEIRALVPVRMREMIADRTGLPVERIALLNPRWSEDGDVFEADGFEILSS